ncbi:short-chain dehydrogenase [Mycolicibacterium madagascariense]|uniref:Short-chain dehydrogenase n=1 Tax=Mycolicibacterium madagascariense TaxID=212765 RepID=A0A7I7XLY8_9MYCO|nr:SDR family NAD(P)-dependent oxidoreductase [Mycolicibacterium madagascariense]MCV7012560.1 SDR family NAD(P)-dependent oxidoreductase [Mycolicibacterium madagascariense]BBZ30241.1 short-chain dehydrogenase [Mycolicibacterium madagascariense]
MTRATLDRVAYGPWALVVGASDGVGAAFAEAVAGSGIGVVLLARRGEVLDRVADGIRSRTGAETRVLVVDLGTPDAAKSIVAATSDLEIGLLIYCAGADTDYQPFLSNSIDAAETMLRRNCLIPMQLSHHYGRAMAQRGRGGIVILSSGAAFVGAPNMAVYGATKAFDMIFAESLWSELRGHGVDALGVVLGVTDTPSLRRTREQRGLAGADEPVPGATAPEEVVHAAFAGLGRVPTVMAGKQIRRGARFITPIPRSLLVRIMVRASRRAMGPDE